MNAGAASSGWDTVFLREVSDRRAGLAQSLRILSRGVHEVIDIVARNDEASAELCELGLQFEISPNAAHAQKLPVLLTCRRGDFIGLANFGVLHHSVQGKGPVVRPGLGSAGQASGGDQRPGAPFPGSLDR